jgi:PAS domain S-box-containing protein
MNCHEGSGENPLEHLSGCFICGTGETVSEPSAVCNELPDSDHMKLLIEPASGQIIDANDAALSFYGYCRKEITSMKITEINVLPYFIVMKKRYEAVRSAGSSFIFPHRLASGEIKEVEVHSCPVILEGRKHLLSVIKEIPSGKA